MKGDFGAAAGGGDIAGGVVGEWEFGDRGAGRLRERILAGAVSRSPAARAIRGRYGRKASISGVEVRVV